MKNIRFFKDCFKKLENYRLEKIALKKQQIIESINKDWTKEEIMNQNYSFARPVAVLYPTAIYHSLNLNSEINLNPVLDEDALKFMLLNSNRYLFSDEEFAELSDKINMPKTKRLEKK
ncbi:MAG: hypothetical protein RSB77_02640 [Bacilli bacterium]